MRCKCCGGVPARTVNRVGAEVGSASMKGSANGRVYAFLWYSIQARRVDSVHLPIKSNVVVQIPIIIAAEMPPPGESCVAFTVTPVGKVGNVMVGHSRPCGEIHRNENSSV